MIERLDLMAAFTEPRPVIDMVLPGLVAGTTAFLVGPGGVSKSFLALQTAVTIALGEDVWSLWTDGEKLHHGRVVVLNLEDVQPILQIRMHDIASHLPLSREQMELVAEHVDIMPLYGTGFSIAEREGRSGAILPSQWMLHVEDYVKGARLVVLDTFNRSLGSLDENSSGDMGAAISILEGICRRVGCAVLILHHMNKSGGRSESEQQQQAARGASAISDNTRWQTQMLTMSEREAEIRSIDGEDRRRWVQIDLTKVNYGPPTATRWLLRDKGGVLSGRVQPPTRTAKHAANKKGRIALEVVGD